MFIVSLLLNLIGLPIALKSNASSAISASSANAIESKRSAIKGGLLTTRQIGFFVNA